MKDVPLQPKVNMWFQQDGAQTLFGANVGEYLNIEFAIR